jgi:cellulose synthase operon protein C
MAQEPANPANYNEKAMALYADAANFQTNGALELAIEGWTKFLTKYPDEPFASKAAHYLGVCYMQQATPDYPAAIGAFEKAVKDAKSELREESLVNLGWCQYAAAGEGEQQDKARLQSAMETFRTLLKEKPASKFADRALFYGGEAAYALGNAKDAIAFYDKLIAMESAKDSPLRCATFYARGVALEDLQKLDDAVVSYRQLIDGCKDDRLLVDARVRVGDVYIQQKKFAEAAQEFAAVAAGTSDDVPYALVRQAFSAVQAGKPQDAAALYERLLKEFPESPYTASATLASAQSVYRAGDMDEAEKRFTRVLSQKDPNSATEAAHWLSMIALKKGNAKSAMEIAQKQIDAGAAGEYAPMLKMDLAEAMMMVSDKVADAQKLFLSIYQSAPQDAQAPRALYNAAFASLQLGQTKEASELAEQFLTKFKDSPLSTDIRYIVAESKLMGGAHADAAAAYQTLLQDPATEKNVQRPLWILRAGMASFLASKNDDAIKLLSDNLKVTAAPAQLAEAKYIIGASHLAAGRPNDAVTAFRESLKSDPKWMKADETTLLLGQAVLASGNADEASKVWDGLTKSFPQSSRAGQARYRIAQLAARSGSHDAAAKEYETVIKTGTDASLTPLALYGLGWNLLQAGKPSEAIAPLNRAITEFPNHAIVDESKLALGIALRTLGKTDEAVAKLQDVLKDVPEGVNRGHALYELALIDQQLNRPAEAAKRLEQLVASVPNYPSMDKVLYEWSWSLKESDQNEQAEKAFSQLIEKYPQNPLAAEGHYFIGQQRYAAEKWQDAAKSFESAVSVAADKELLEKSLYRLGWSRFKTQDYEGSHAAFERQAKEFPEGKLIADALLMAGENRFKQEKYEDAFAAYSIARDRIAAKNETAQTLADPAERQVRELVFLHGGQSAAQLKKWKEGLAWYDELRKRFPETLYLAQALYESGFAHQQLENDAEALKFFEKVATDYRNETAARSRFMIGEIYFGRRDLAKAIPEFQRVMYGYGAEKADSTIKNWQAKSGFEAGRCSELLIQSASDKARREQSAKIAKEFFKYVIEKHPTHELASKSQERLDVLNRMKFDVGATNRPQVNPGVNRKQAAN